MKRFLKILALTLVLANLLLLPALINIHADDGAVGRINLLYDQYASIPVIKEAPATMTLAENVADNGVKYYTAAYNEGWTVEMGGYTSRPYIQIATPKHYLKNGWYSGDTTEGVDDTDYLVIDFDISTETNHFDSILLQTLFYYGQKTEQTDGSYKGVRKSAQSGHYSLVLADGNDPSFGVSNDASIKMPIDPLADDEWAHITMVVDATVDTDRVMHLYYNGRFVDSRVCMTDNGVYLEAIRIGLGSSGVAPNYDNESFSYANMTVKSFSRGYQGELSSNSDKLGDPLYPISSFSDLSYCLLNQPENIIAEVTHADGTVTSVNKVAELDGNLAAGDSVKLMKDITRKIVVPGALDGETLVSSVSFDLNGYSMTSPLILADYEDYDWIVRDENGDILTYEADGATVYGKGSQEYTDGALATDNLSAFLLGAFPSGVSGGADVRITFLKDSAISFTSSLNTIDATVTFDLNSRVMTISGGSTPFKSGSASAKVVVKGGSLVNGASNPVYLVHNTAFYFVNVDLTLNSSLCDQRAGILYFVDSKITTTQTISAIKSYSNGTSSAVFDGCEIVASGESPIYFSNLRTGGARRGSMNNFVGLYDTKATSETSLVSVNYYANEWETTNAAALSNQNKVGIRLVGADITVTGDEPLVVAEIQTLKDLSGVFAEGLSANTTLYINSTNIEADILISSVDDGAIRALSGSGVSVGGYTANTNVIIKKSSLRSGNYLFKNTVGEGSVNGALSVTLHDGVMLTTKQWAEETDSAVNVEFIEGVKLAYSYRNDYPYTATTDWTESTLVGNRPDRTTVKLSDIFSDNMVLQANKDINIYGSCATVGATIEVTLADTTLTTTVSGDGTWRVTFPPMGYEKNLTIEINEVGLLFPKTVINKVHIGEVWMISGQSNAVYGVYKMEDFEEYKKNADNFDNIYAFAVSQSHSLVEESDATNSGWYNVNSSTLNKDERYSGISAIAYVMATRLATELGRDVTVGIVDINFNGSTVEAWMSADNLQEADKEYYDKYLAYRDFYLENGVYPSESDVSGFGSYVSSGKLYQKMACSCYNAMIAPFFDGYSIRGVIWDQGGGNAAYVDSDSDGGYTKHFTGVRDTFRDVFCDDELPVFMIQLSARMSDPFYFRALLYDIAEADDNTYLVASPTSGSTYSANELKYTNPVTDSMVHYERKSPVGLALADSMLENVYGMGECSKPNIVSVESISGSIVITFDRDVTIDLGCEMLGFEIAGEGAVWVPATATYEGNVVTLTAEGLSSPDRVRYGYGKCLLTLEDGTEIIHAKEDATFSYNEQTGEVTIVANGNTYVIDTEDPAVIGSRLAGNVVATNGSALPVFLIIVPREV